jgi:hypothetical protein
MSRFGVVSHRGSNNNRVKEITRGWGMCHYILVIVHFKAKSKQVECDMKNLDQEKE